MKRIILTAVVIVLAASAAQAAGKEYSADMVMHSANGDVSGKVYASGQLLRYEMGPAVTITRLDRKTSYVLMPEQKMYMEQPMDPSAGVRAGVESEGNATLEPLGQETFDGRSVEKVKVTTTDANGSTVVYQWIDSDGLPAKVEAEDGSWSVEYRNKAAGPQPADLFEVPADYQPLAMPDIGAMLASDAQ